MPRTTAERQELHRARTEARVREFRALLDELAAACERGRCHQLCARLPDEPAAAMAELRERLKHKRLIVCNLEGKGHQ